jgi:hypothetical protein
MNRHLILGASFVAGAALLLCAAPAIAHGNVQWSVTVGTPQYYSPHYSPQPTVVYPAPVVVYPQSQFTYGAPPSVYAPPAGAYIQPPQVYPQQTWQVEQYRQPHAYHDRSWRERDDRRERYERQERRERYESGDRRDGRHWGNREQRR